MPHATAAEIAPPRPSTPDARPPGPPLRRFLILLTVVTAIRLAAAAAIPLTGDEAYYWTWTRHLDLGYHDHPPMVAWIIWLSTRLLGTHTFTVRLPFVLIGSLTAWASFLLGWSVVGTARAAQWSGGLALAVPLFTLAGIGVFPDSPLLLFCGTFFVLAWRAGRGLRDRDWLLAGACAGAAASSKLTGLYLIPAFLIYLGLGPSQLLRRRGPWLMIAASLVVLGPFIYWNATHQFESIAYQYGSRLGGGHHRLYTPTFILLSAAALSPVLYPMLMWGMLRAGWLGLRGDSAMLYLACMALPLHLVFLACSFVTKIGLHWTAPGTLAAFTAFAAWLEAPGRPSRRIWARLGLALAIAISGLVYFFTFAPATLVGMVSNGVQMSGINHGERLRTDEITEVLGYPEVGERVRALAEASPEAFLITTNYTLSSALWFYSGHPFHVIMGSRIGAQYDHWDPFASLLGRDAIYVDTSPIPSREDVWTNLHKAFAEVSLDPPFVSHGHGVEARTYYVARCRRFRDDIFTPLQSIHR